MHVDGCFHSFFDVFAAGADFRISRGITSVQSVTNWKHVVDEFEKGRVVVGVFDCVSVQFPVHKGSCCGSPLIFLAQECQQWRTPFGFDNFSFEFVGDGSFWQMQDASAVGKQGDFSVLITVVDHVGFSKIVGIHIELCRKRQLLVGLVVILVAFDPSQRRRMQQFTPAHHNFIDDVPVCLQSCVCKVFDGGRGFFDIVDNAFVVTKALGGEPLFLFDGVE
jgi:hypothetical protein